MSRVHVAAVGVAIVLLILICVAATQSQVAGEIESPSSTWPTGPGDDIEVVP